ncbi:tail fiber domain-containing protein [Candidatus Azambacteria bacterium]|nr:tail fiber domain-containing protein [Candidatus Azambacteria bacterium]
MNEDKNINQANKYISLSEASQISGISRDYLNVLIRRGKLRAIKEGKNWLVTKKWLEECRAPRETNNVIKSGSDYLSLFNAAKIANVSSGYLNVAVRRGKLKAAKLGRNWFTTIEWLGEYRKSVGRINSGPEADLSSEILMKEEKAELENLKAKLIIESAFEKAAEDKRELIERLKNIESKVEGISAADHRQRPQTFNDREISKKSVSFVVSQEVKLPARILRLEEKSKILEEAKTQSGSGDNLEFQRASRLLGASRHLKNWSHLKFSLVSGLAVLIIVASLGLASGLIPPPDTRALSNLPGLKYQAGIFSDIFSAEGGPASVWKNFSNDAPSFFQWLASGLGRSLSFFKTRPPSELTVEKLETGESKIITPQEIASSISTLAEAEALDAPSAALAEEGLGAPSFVKTTEGKNDFIVFENRLSIVEANLKDQNDLIDSELSLQKKTILGVLEAMFGIAKLTPEYPISTVVVQGQPATLTTYSVAPQVQTGFDRLSATYLNLASDAVINGALTVKSGANLNSLSVSGNTAIGGALAVAGDTTMANASTTANFTVAGTAWLNKLSVTGTATTTFNNPITSFSGDFTIAGDSASNLLLNPYGGYVGIGTTTPGSLLSVHSSGNVYFGGNLTVSGNSFFNNASTTNGTITNFWSTYGTITNASTTYLTVGSNFWGASGLFSNAVQTPLVWNNGPLTASTTGANPLIFAASSTERMRITPDGYVAIGTTTPTQALTIQGNQFIYGGLGVGMATTTNGAIQTSGDVYVGRNLYVSGNSTVIGGSSADTLTVNSSINSNLIPDLNAARDLGSTAKYWNNAYINTLTANNISAASTTIGGTQSATFTINSDNATSDNENSSLIFWRGTVVPNAILTWNSATSSKRFEFNQTLYINNGSASTTNPALTVQTIANQTANAFQIIDNNSANIFSVNPVGSNTAMINASTTNLTVSGNLWSNTNSTSTFNGAVLLSNGSASAPSLAFINSTATGIYRAGSDKMSLVTNATDRLTFDSSGNVGIGTTTPSDPLDIYKSIAGQTKTSIINPNSQGYTTLSLGTNSSGEASLNFYNSSYVTSLLQNALELNTAGSGNILIRPGGYTGVGSMYGSSVAPQNTIDIGTNDAFNNTIVDEAALRHYTTGTAGNGLGAGLSFYGQSSNGTSQQLARIAGVVEQATTTSTFGSGLSFWTNGATGLLEKMRINQNGNIGIGTTAPGAKLDVNDGAIRMSVGGNERGLISYDGSNNGVLRLTNSADSQTVFLTAGTGNSYFNSGNVGIGTTAPLSKLSVGFAGYAATNFAVKQPGADFYGIIVEASASDAWLRLAHNGTIGILDTSYNATAGFTPLTMWTGGSERLRIDTSGNVGIGTTAPGGYGKFEVVQGTNGARAAYFNAPANGYGILVAAGSTSDHAIASFQNSSGDTKMYIRADGKVGIGTTSPNGKLSVVYTAETILGGYDNAGAYAGTYSNHNFGFITNNTRWMVIDTSGKVGIGTTNPGYQLDLSTDDARKLTTTTWLTGSDRRIKTNIQTIDDALDIISRVRPVKFHYTPEFLAAHPSVKDTDYYNFIAQEYGQVFPNSVSTSTDGLLYLNTSNMIPYAIAGIKELASTTIALQNQINALTATSSLTAKSGTFDLTTLNSDLNVNSFSILNVKSIAGASGLWKIDESGNITAQNVNTQALTVGGGAASGVTVYDRETAAPKCIYIERGLIKTSDGVCGATQNTGTASDIVVLPTATATPPSVELPPMPTTTPETLPASTTTPETLPPIELTATTTPEAIPIATSTPPTATTTP